MTWVNPPSFTVGETLTAALQNQLSGDLTFLINQIGLYADGPQTLVTTSPGNDQPYYQVQAGFENAITVTTGVWNFVFPQAFLNGVLTMIAIPATGTTNNDTMQITPTGNSTTHVHGLWYRNNALFTGTGAFCYIAIGF